MGISFNILNDDKDAARPQCRLDAAIDALEKYYTATGNETTTGTYDDRSLFSQIGDMVSITKD